MVAINFTVAQAFDLVQSHAERVREAGYRDSALLSLADARNLYETPERRKYVRRALLLSLSYSVTRFHPDYARVESLDVQ